MNEPTIKDKIFDQHTKDSLKRGLYMILYIFIIYVTWFLLFAIVFIEFILNLVFKEPNRNLASVAETLNKYAYDLFQYLTYNSDKLLFPLAPWPGTKNEQAEANIEKK